MTWNSRLCRQCDARFAPSQIDQRLCGACAAQTDDLQKLLTYLRVHPEDPVTRVSVATGVSEQSIAQLAQAGQLPVVPLGAEAKPSCTCDGRSRCPVCKAAVARRIVRAAGPSAALTELEAMDRARAAGMRSRRPSAS